MSALWYHIRKKAKLFKSAEKWVSLVFRSSAVRKIQRCANLVPIGRMAERNEYKSAIQFFITDASSYMIGAVLVMYVGRRCGW